MISWRMTFLNWFIAASQDLDTLGHTASDLPTTCWSRPGIWEFVLWNPWVDEVMKGTYVCMSWMSWSHFINVRQWVVQWVSWQSYCRCSAVQHRSAGRHFKVWPESLMVLPWRQGSHSLTWLLDCMESHSQSLWISSIGSWPYFLFFGTSGSFPAMLLEGSEIQPLLAVAPGSDKLPLEVIGILAALNNKHNTGLGQHVDISMLDVSVALLANQGMNYLAKKQRQKRVGNNHPNVVPYQVMPAKDGDLFARNRQSCLQNSHIDFPQLVLLKEVPFIG